MYKVTIGLEVHCELESNTKNFSPAPNGYTNYPNEHVATVDLGLPGILPVPNKFACRQALLTAQALNCENPDEVIFDRKNYFYADLPKGYQITQNTKPMGINGYLDIMVDGKIKRVDIHDLHLEEDTASLEHNTGYSLIDYNRSGVPLIEVVSEPDLRTLSEIKEYLEKLRHIMRYIGISDCKMQEGSMRCDINVSVRKVGEKDLNIKTELKNINSISHIIKAVDYEFKRQVELLNEGKEVLKETRFYNENSKKTEVMRRKEDQKEYKYFKEPDIPMIKIDKREVEKLFKTLPEMPNIKLKKYIEEYDLTEYQANILVKYRNVAQCFEKACKNVKNKRKVANFIINEIFESLDTQENKQSFTLPIKEENLNNLMLLVDEGKIPSSFAKEIYKTMVQNKKDLKQILKESRKSKMSKKEVEKICKEVINSNKKAVKDYVSGKKKAINSLVEEVMKKTNKSLAGDEVLKILKKQIEK